MCKMQQKRCRTSGYEGRLSFPFIFLPPFPSHVPSRPPSRLAQVAYRWQRSVVCSCAVRRYRRSFRNPTRRRWHAIRCIKIRFSPRVVEGKAGYSVRTRFATRRWRAHAHSLERPEEPNDILPASSIVLKCRDVMMPSSLALHGVISMNQETQRLLCTLRRYHRSQESRRRLRRQCIACLLGRHVHFHPSRRRTMNAATQR